MRFDGWTEEQFAAEIDRLRNGPGGRDTQVALRETRQALANSRWRTAPDTGDKVDD